MNCLICEDMLTPSARQGPRISLGTPADALGSVFSPRPPLGPAWARSRLRRRSRFTGCARCRPRWHAPGLSGFPQARDGDVASGRRCDHLRAGGAALRRHSPQISRRPRASATSSASTTSSAACRRGCYNWSARPADSSLTASAADSTCPGRYAKTPTSSSSMRALRP